MSSEGVKLVQASKRNNKHLISQIQQNLSVEFNNPLPHGPLKIP